MKIIIIIIIIIMIITTKLITKMTLLIIMMCSLTTSQFGIDLSIKVLNWDADTIIRLQLWEIAGEYIVKYLISTNR